MIKTISEYIEARVKIIDPAIKRLPRPFEPDVSDTNVENSFFLHVGDDESEEENTVIYDSFQVEIKIYGDGKNKPVEIYNDLYCKAIKIRNSVFKPQNWNGKDYISKIRPLSITPGTIGRDDNTFVFTIKLIVTTVSGTI